MAVGVCLLDTDSDADHTRGRSRNFRAALHELPASRGTAWLTLHVAPVG